MPDLMLRQSQVAMRIEFWWVFLKEEINLDHVFGNVSSIYLIYGYT